MRRSSTVLKVLLCIFWLFAVILPLLRMLAYIHTVDVMAMVTARKFTRAFRQSVAVSAVGTLISLSLAGLLAWCVARTNVKHKGLISMVLSVPMLIPSISHGMGLIIILGANGWMSRLLGLSNGIYGFWGIVIGSVMYSFPVAYLMLYDILQYEDGTPYEAAEVMGLSSMDRLLSITLPYLRKPLISVFFATFTMIITDYGVPLMVGGKYTTLPVMMYQDVIGMLDFGKGSVIGLILLAPALVACILDIMNRDKGNAGFVGKEYAIKDNSRRDLTAGVICIVSMLLILLPILSFAVLGFLNKYPIDMTLSLKNVQQAFHMGAGRYLINSVVIAVVVSLAGTAVAVINAYMTARSKTNLSGILHLMSISSLAIPGLVLGLSYVMFFKKTLIYGTFAMLFLVNSVHFFASPYLMAYNTFGKINEHLESVGATMGITRFNVFKDVIMPQSWGTILEMMSYFFVNSMMTISAVSFLANVTTKPIALMITQFEGQMQLECAAFVSVIILLINVIMKGFFHVARKKLVQV